mmetsp:Transcript_125210/g.401086  ORF Transcript_125210/g.401086 Transcript_125210/m.401086 type:complete len:363 (+) Transcript_125210:85-1173(+)
MIDGWHRSAVLNAEAARRLLVSLQHGEGLGTVAAVTRRASTTRGPPPAPELPLPPAGPARRHRWQWHRCCRQRYRREADNVTAGAAAASSGTADGSGTGTAGAAATATTTRALPSLPWTAPPPPKSEVPGRALSPDFAATALPRGRDAADARGRKRPEGRLHSASEPVRHCRQRSGGGAFAMRWHLLLQPRSGVPRPLLCSRDLGTLLGLAGRNRSRPTLRGLGAQHLRLRLEDLGVGRTLLRLLLETGLGLLQRLLRLHELPVALLIYCSQLPPGAANAALQNTTALPDATLQLQQALAGDGLVQPIEAMHEVFEADGAQASDIDPVEHVDHVLDRDVRELLEPVHVERRCQDLHVLLLLQ